MRRKSLTALATVVFLAAKTLPNPGCKSNACTYAKAQLKGEVESLRKDAERERRMKLSVARERDGLRDNVNYLHRRLNEYEMSQAELYYTAPGNSGVDEVPKIRKG